MKNKLRQALCHISDKHIAEAATHKKRPVWGYLGAIAAALAVAILLSTLLNPLAINAKAVSLAPACRAPVRPDMDDYPDMDSFWADMDRFNALREQEDAVVEQTILELTGFFQKTSQLYLEGTKNRIWSPINAYLALATLAEITAGDSRQQVLTALNTEDLDTLRTQSSLLFEEVYKEGNEATALANSLWLHDDLSYNQEAIDNLSYHYYTSVYQADLASSGAGKALAAWLDENTGGLLKQYTANAGFPPEAVLTLASTVYLQAKWSDEFSAAKNTTAAFHGVQSDSRVTFMNKENLETTYYWADNFGAVGLWLKNNCRMWLFLPDEGKTPADVLSGEDYLRILREDQEWSQEKYMKVRLSLPKFDISSSDNVADVFRALGVRDVFDPLKSDFTAISAQVPVTLTGANQAARVQIDEQGVKAASYIEFPGAGAAPPPDETIDFILDRPFVFVIADNSGIPLFTGTVNQL